MSWLLFVTVALAEITVAEAPRLEESVSIAVTNGVGQPVPGVPVRVVSRPGARGAVEVNVGLSDARGEVRWTPELPGPVVVRALDDEVRVHVPYRDPPLDLLIVLAGLLAACVAASGYGLSPLTRKA